MPTKRMLKAAGRIVPGLEEKVVFADLGTPHTNEHYVAATAGSVYGTEKTKDHVGPWAFSTKTEIAGLALCGASAVSHGVLGATLSGLLVARELLGGQIGDLLDAGGPALTIYDPENPATWPERARRHAAVREPSLAVDG